jgi:putative FmdB family regulatory protein
MPLYAYRCNDCSIEFEQRQKFSDDPLTECPNCEGHIRRVVNSVGIVFKGSGFYVTDNRNGKSGSKSNVASKEQSEKPTDEKQSDTKSENIKEAKSETKAETKTETAK